MAHEDKVKIIHEGPFKRADGSIIPMAGGPDSPESKVKLIVLEGEARFGTADNPIVIKKPEDNKEE